MGMRQIVSTFIRTGKNYVMQSLSGLIRYLMEVYFFFAITSAKSLQMRSAVQKGRREDGEVWGWSLNSNQWALYSCWH